MGEQVHIDCNLARQNNHNQLYIIKPQTKSKDEDPESRFPDTCINEMNVLGMFGEADAFNDSVDLSGCKLMSDADVRSGLHSIFPCKKFPQLNWKKQSNRSLQLPKLSAAVNRHVVS